MNTWHKQANLAAGLSFRPAAPARPQAFAAAMAHRSGKQAMQIMALEEQIRTMREALVRITNEGDRASVRIAKMALVASASVVEDDQPTNDPASNV